MNFKFKICQTVAAISRISQFHEFINEIFGGFLPLGPFVGRCLSGPLRRVSIEELIGSETSVA